VLLHGLGETGNELLGIHAWGERYGLVRAHERLRKPPVSREYPKLDYLEEARARQLNQSLERRPYRGAVLVCPVTPNPHRGNSASILERYTSWLVDTLLPAVRQKVGASSRVRVGLDGCSLGGYVGLEVLLRRPEAFQSFGLVQPAIGQASAVHYAARIAELISRVGPCPLHIETSSGDPYREPSRRLSEELSVRGVPNQFRLSPGPHNQPWLREVGTLEMLLWHDRQLNHAAA
jgi:enterochelin esterase-like enzyme